MVHGWPQKTVLASGRTALLVEEGMNLVGHLREKGQVLPSKNFGNLSTALRPRRGCELDLATTRRHRY
jgi:hypothetical protein